MTERAPGRRLVVMEANGVPGKGRMVPPLGDGLEEQRVDDHGRHLVERGDAVREAEHRL